MDDGRLKIDDDRLKMGDDKLTIMMTGLPWMMIDLMNDDRLINECLILVTAP